MFSKRLILIKHFLPFHQFTGMQGSENASILANKISSELAEMVETLKKEVADLKINIHQVGINVISEVKILSTDIKDIKNSLVNLEQKINILQENNFSVSLSIKQMMIDWKTDNTELKNNLIYLSNKFSEEFKELESIKGEKVSSLF